MFESLGIAQVKRARARTQFKKPAVLATGTLPHSVAHMHNQSFGKRKDSRERILDGQRDTD